MSRRCRPLHLCHPSNSGATAQPVEILHATVADGETDVEMSLPTIREATPVTPYVADGPALAEAPSVVATTTVPLTGSTPMLPGSQPAAIVLPMPTQPDQSARAVAAMSPLAVEIPQRARRRSEPAAPGSSSSLRWWCSARSSPAPSCSDARICSPTSGTRRPSRMPRRHGLDGTEFDEPFTVIAEPTDDYSVMSTAQLAGDFAAGAGLACARAGHRRRDRGGRCRAARRMAAGHVLRLRRADPSRRCRATPGARTGCPDHGSDGDRPARPGVRLGGRSGRANARRRRH